MLLQTKQLVIGETRSNTQNQRKRIKTSRTTYPIEERKIYKFLIPTLKQSIYSEA